jgi:catechol 2,3-dioxygenase-like lactoylglutathione lyase family enzyme
MFAHHHLNVSSAEEHRKFFVDTLGGAAIRVGANQTEAVKFPNALLMLRRQAPSGGTKGTTVNHIAFGVPDIRRTVETVKAAGYPMVTRAELPASLEVHDNLCYMTDQETFVAFTMAPDETKVEFIEIKSQAVPIRLHHIHFASPDVAGMKAWHVKVLGAKPGKRGNFEAADLPCVNLTYSPAASPVVGTTGRVLDRIGFELEGLDAFCRNLESIGIGLDRPVTNDASLGARTAIVTDPWGTAIELTEGLAGPFAG